MSRYVALSFLFTTYFMHAISHVSFDTGLRTVDHPDAINRSFSFMGIDGHALYSFFKQLYQQNMLQLRTPGITLKIPKIIHQIWLGSPVPEVYGAYMQSWRDKHPGWEYFLWTDETVKTVLPLYNQEFYDAAENYGTKSDILRWELLYRFGGLYADMDHECLNPVDELHYVFDFYTGIQPLDAIFLQLGAALVGSIPGHPILKHCIETVKDDWHLQGAPKKTGPVHFTRSFYACAGRGTCDVALPPFYVYPLGSTEKATEESYQRWIRQGSYAIHWWSKSWMPKKYRPARFRVIDNEKSAESWND